MHFEYKKSGTGGVTLQLVESFRDDGLPRNRLVASLGCMKMPESWHKPLAKAVEAKLRGGTPTLPSSLPKAAAVLLERIMAKVELSSRRKPNENLNVAAEIRASRNVEVPKKVLTSRISFSHDTPLGPYLSGLRLWDYNNLTQRLVNAGLSQQQALVVEAMVLSKMGKPSSGVAFHSDLSMTSLPELLGSKLLNLSPDIIRRTTNKLLDAKPKVMSAMLDIRSGPTDSTRVVMLYHFAWIRFHDSHGDNSQRGADRSGERHNDRPQMVEGVVFDSLGYVVAHKVFLGAQLESKPLPEMVEAMRAEVAEALQPNAFLPLVVVDGGFVSETKIKELHEANLAYIVQESRSAWGKWEAQFALDGFASLPGLPPETEVQAKAIDLPATGNGSWLERVLLCRSWRRKGKSSTPCGKSEPRLLDDLKTLAKRIGGEGVETVAALDQEVQRLCQRHPWASGFYEITTQDADGLPVLSWVERCDRMASNASLPDSLVLRTNYVPLKEAEMWKLHTAWVNFKKLFLSIKGRLALRPADPRLEDLAQSQALLTIMAYQLARKCLRRLNLRSWTSVRRILATHCYRTVILPQPDGSVLRIRRPGEPDAIQARIYQELGVQTVGMLPIYEMTVAPGKPVKCSDEQDEDVGPGVTPSIPGDMEPENIRHSLIESMLQNEASRDVKAANVIYFPFKAEIDSMQVCEKTTNSEVAKQEIAEYKKLLDKIEKYRSPTPLSIQLRHARFYADEHPELIKLANLAIENYMSNKPFDINDIVRFVERNCLYFFDACAVAYLEILHKKRVAIKAESSGIKFVVKQIVFYKLEAYLHDDDERKLLVKIKVSDFAEKHEWLASIWPYLKPLRKPRPQGVNEDRMKRDYYAWRSKIITDVLSQLRLFFSGSNLDRKAFEKTDISALLNKKGYALIATNIGQTRNYYVDLAGEITGNIDGLCDNIKTLMEKYGKWREGDKKFMRSLIAKMETTRSS